MAHKKGQGSSNNGRDSNPQYLGVKRFGGQQVPFLFAAIVSHPIRPWRRFVVAPSSSPSHHAPAYS